MTYTIDLAGKNALVMGVANQRSISWSIADALYKAGANVAFTYQTDRFKNELEKLTAEQQNPLLIECDVSNEDTIASVFDTISERMGNLSILIHGIAFARREDISGKFSETSREGFLQALEISAYSIIPISKYASNLMEKDGGSIIAMTFQASEKVFPGYNVMGAAKAALENSVRQLAVEFGPHNIRVNAISAGPLNTLAARGIKGFTDMRKVFEARSALKRNITHDEVGKTALFLGSDLGTGITGAVIPVDAGYNIVGV